MKRSADREWGFGTGAVSRFTGVVFLVAVLWAPGWNVWGAQVRAVPPARAVPPVTNGVERAADSNAAVSVETVRTFLSKWVETEQLAARERREAVQSKDILVARVEVLKEGMVAMSEKLAQAEEKFAQAQKQKADATAQLGQNSAAVAQLAADVSGLEASLRALHPRLPPPLIEKIRTLYERMPAETNNVRVSIAERCQNVLGVLNEINKFNSDIVMVYDVRNLSDGKPSEVTCVYVGLGQAYSISPLGEAAVGRPGPQGWTWTPAPDSAEAITLTLEILKNKAKPMFVPLPVELE